MSAALASKIEQKHHTPPHDLEINGVQPLGIRVQPITRGRRKKDFQCYEVLLLVNKQSELWNYLNAIYEDNNKSFELFKYVTNQATEYFSEREENFSINVTPENILHSQFESFLNSIENITKERILLEVLEHSPQFQEDTDFVIEKLKKIKEQWYRIAMDDYGSDHSNLERLELFINQKILDILKIDGDFFNAVLEEINNDSSDKKHLTEIKSVMKLAFRNKVKVIIEKIEEDEWVQSAYDIAIEIWKEIGKTNLEIEELMWFQGFILKEPMPVVYKNNPREPIVYKWIKN